MSSDEVTTKMCFNITIIIKEIVNQPAISFIFFIPIIHFANKAFSVEESKEVDVYCCHGSSHFKTQILRPYNGQSLLGLGLEQQQSKRRRCVRKVSTVASSRGCLQPADCSPREAATTEIS